MNTPRIALSMLTLGTSLVVAPVVHGATPLRRDFNGDGRDDIMCRNIDNGHIWIDYANSSGQFGGTNWNASSQFCIDGELHFGDVTGDGRVDMICHSASGIGLDFASGEGRFEGLDWFRAAAWCTGADQNLRIGDFNGDGLADLLCHNRVNGSIWIDYADYNIRFQGTDWSRANAFCRARTEDSMFVGDFNGDGRDDLLCTDKDTGHLYIDYWVPSQGFAGTDWHGDGGCWDSAPDDLYLIYSRRVGDFNGDGRDDLLCYPEWHSPNILISYANSSGQLPAINWAGSPDDCNDGRFWGLSYNRYGDYNGDGRDDIMCHSPYFGGDLWIDYADRWGNFYGRDWERDANWCGGDRQRLY